VGEEGSGLPIPVAFGGKGNIGATNPVGGGSVVFLFGLFSDRTTLTRHTTNPARKISNAESARPNRTRKGNGSDTQNADNAPTPSATESVT